MFNRYSYTLNDPINMIDPDGMRPITQRCKSASCQERMLRDVGMTDSDIESFHQMRSIPSKMLVNGGSLAVGGPIAGSGRKAAVGGVGLYFLRRGATKSFSGANKYISKTIGSLGKTKGMSSQAPVAQTFTGGGQSAANNLFQTLTKGKSELAKNGTTRLGKLGDGSVVNMSTNAKGVTSVRIQQARASTGTRIRKTIKVRFKED